MSYRLHRQTACGMRPVKATDRRRPQRAPASRTARSARPPRLDFTSPGLPCRRGYRAKPCLDANRRRKAPGTVSKMRAPDGADRVPDRACTPHHPTLGRCVSRLFNLAINRRNRGSTLKHAAFIVSVVLCKYSRGWEPNHVECSEQFDTQRGLKSMRPRGPSRPSTFSAGATRAPFTSPCGPTAPGDRKLNTPAVRISYLKLRMQSTHVTCQLLRNQDDGLRRAS
jgi:hypothetical protein